MNEETTNVYHITHIDNLATITHDGFLFADSVMRQKKSQNVSIAYHDLKERRLNTKIRLPRQASNCIGEYVPFYFANRSPMLYVTSQYGVDGKRTPQNEIVYLVSTVEAITASGLQWCFTDGHAVEAITCFYEHSDDLRHVDWKMVDAEFWANSTEDPDRKRRKQSEFLVYEKFPISLVTEIGVYDTIAQENVYNTCSTAALNIPVNIQTSWYY